MSEEIQNFHKEKQNDYKKLKTTKRWKQSTERLHFLTQKCKMPKRDNTKWAKT